jgi:hypothetical protein
MGSWSTWKGSVLGRFVGLVVLVQYIFVLPWLLYSQSSPKYYFPHRTYSIPHCPATWAGSRAVSGKTRERLTEWNSWLAAPSCAECWKHHGSCPHKRSGNCCFSLVRIWNKKKLQECRTYYFYHSLYICFVLIDALSVFDLFTRNNTFKLPVDSQRGGSQPSLRIQKNLWKLPPPCDFFWSSFDLIIFIILWLSDFMMLHWAK